MKTYEEYEVAISKAKTELATLEEKFNEYKNAVSESAAKKIAILLVKDKPKK